VFAIVRNLGRDVLCNLLSQRHGLGRHRNHPAKALLYSGRQDERKHGVDSLLNPEWQQALKDWKGINKRLLYARFLAMP
jgi:hypothetical protein